MSALSAVQIAPAAPMVRFSLRLSPSDAAKTGLDLPARIQGLCEANGVSAMKLGPDEWLLLCPPAEAKAMVLRAESWAFHHALIDISERDLAFDITGEGATHLLQTFLPFDLDAMPAPAACRSIFDKVQIVVAKQGESRYRIEMGRSFAPHVAGLLGRVYAEMQCGL